MSYCSRCGVEVEEHVKKCPLCNIEIEKNNEIPDLKGNFPTDDLSADDYYIPIENRKKIVWSIISFIMSLSLLVIFAVNFLLERTVTWGWIPLFSILFAWGTIGLVYYSFKKPYYLSLLLFILTTTYFYFLFFIINTISHFFRLALPINTAVFINTFFILYLSKISRIKGYNIPGFILSGTSLICVLIDVIITYYITSKIIITWSIVVIVLLIPLSLFLFYIHYILKKRPDIKKIFHI